MQSIMQFINMYGLVFLVMMAIPGMMFAGRTRDKLPEQHFPMALRITEMLGRFGSMGFMVIIIPGLGFGFPSEEVFAVYLIVDMILVCVYCGVQAILSQKPSRGQQLVQAIISSVIFLFSGITAGYWPLILCGLIFAVGKIWEACITEFY